MHHFHVNWHWQGNNSLGPTGATSLARGLQKLTSLMELNLVSRGGLEVPAGDSSERGSLRLGVFRVASKSSREAAG